MTDTEYRDTNGKRLADYPHPSVAVDTAVMTVVDGELSVLQVRDVVDGDWRLPGTFVHEGERLADSVLRSLREKAGVEGLAPRQLHVFDDPARDSRGWVLSVAHLDVVPAASLAIDEDRARLVPVAAAGAMVHAHDDILEYAVAQLREDHRERPDPHGLLAEPFTMTELRRLHEVVLGMELQPDTFRRAMAGRLAVADGKRAEGPGRPAGLHRRR